MLGCCLLVGAAAQLACDDAQLVRCAPGTYVRDSGGTEYCVYAPDRPPRAASGEARCPRELPVLTELEGGFVCALREVDPDELPALLGLGLRAPSELDASAPDAGPPPPDAAITAAPEACGAGAPRALSPAQDPRTPAAWPDLIARSGGGYAVAWGGSVRLLDEDGTETSALPVGGDPAFGYGLVELGSTIAVASAEGGTLRVAQLDGGTASSWPAEAALDGNVALVRDDAGGLWCAYCVGSGFDEELRAYRLDPDTLERTPDAVSQPLDGAPTPCHTSLAATDDRILAVAGSEGNVVTIRDGRAVSREILGLAAQALDVAFAPDGSFAIVWAPGPFAFVRDRAARALGESGYGDVSIVAAPSGEGFVVAFLDDSMVNVLHADPRFDHPSPVVPLDLSSTGAGALDATGIDMAAGADGVAVAWIEHVSPDGRPALVVAKVRCP